MKLNDIYVQGSNLAFKLALSVLSFLAYVIAFKMTSHLPDSFKYAGWIYLIFLPAGTKLCWDKADLHYVIWDLGDAR